MAQLFCFGDSITLGHWDKEGGWAARLRREFDQKVIDSNIQEAHVIYNLAIDGDTSEGLRKRFRGELIPRLSTEGDRDIVIINIGINDSELNHTTGKQKVRLDRFRENITAIIMDGTNLVDAIVIVGLTPVDEKRVDPIPWAPQFSYRNVFIQQYDSALKAICVKGKIPFVDIFMPFSKLDYWSLLEDGVHPNTKGHKLLYKEIRSYLFKTEILHS